ncbi:hypothetical protein [Nocardia spumae]|uniref:hypothetical protein n=1 Tax=Nocardia spumae TaxID=2887190 RepID=UPI001D1439A1|nr:hypothetical protein [Nocardia spumae]
MSQPVTWSESAQPDEGARAPAGGGWRVRPVVSPVVQMVGFIGFGVVAVLLVALLQGVSWTDTPAGGARVATAGAEKAQEPAVRTGGGGIAIGPVLDNDGSTLRVRDLTGRTTTVRTDASTSVIVFPGSKVADVGPGSMVVAYGDEQADGSLYSSLVMGLSLGGR